MPEPDQVQIVAPQPVPFTLLADVVHGTGPLGERKSVCRLQIFTPAGTTVLFCDAPAMLQFSKQMRMVANQAGSDLITPPSGLIVPG